MYKRGALTLHALRLTVGDDEYATLVRTWTARHGGGTVTTADFRALAAEHATAGGDALVIRVADLLTAWLDEPALPDLPDGGAAPPDGRGFPGQVGRAEVERAEVERAEAGRAEAGRAHSAAAPS
ncbi:hypothetical protein [Cellulomonas sp. ATA003]|uniref:hypothetical protein n=1 Tax=Cellulomonas sp. ATA003 TaxID=3073064 RepID=UPI002873AAA9|nr:hypothetical protein [Cellulomonas sp. ATA003]WNB85128.1 hypothetical protein REH70_15970 [Cellulomonas sp. ATA003]